MLVPSVFLDLYCTLGGLRGAGLHSSRVPRAAFSLHSLTGILVVDLRRGFSPGGRLSLDPNLCLEILVEIILMIFHYNHRRTCIL